MQEKVSESDLIFVKHLEPRKQLPKVSVPVSYLFEIVWWLGEMNRNWKRDR